MKPWWNKSLLGWDLFWDDVIQQEFFARLNNNLQDAYTNHCCYPVWSEIGKLFTLIVPANIKVVIVGQDPYFRGQADGIAFSAEHSKTTPPSLRNILAELENDCHLKRVDRLSLQGWVKQGVFLMNSIWTVEAHKPLSHAHLGWEQFSATLITWLAQEGIIFCFWGKKALKYKQFIGAKNPVLVHAHPSPLSYRLFRNSKPFSHINKLLQQQKQSVIDWGQ